MKCIGMTNTEGIGVRHAICTGEYVIAELGPFDVLHWTKMFVVTIASKVFNGF